MVKSKTGGSLKYRPQRHGRQKKGRLRLAPLVDRVSSRRLPLESLFTPPMPPPLSLSPPFTLISYVPVNSPATPPQYLSPLLPRSPLGLRSSLRAETLRYPNGFSKLPTMVSSRRFSSIHRSKLSYLRNIFKCLPLTKNIRRIMVNHIGRIFI